MAQEGPVSFEDELVTLYYLSYQKDLRNILLQRVNVKGKHAIEKWGLEIEIKNANPSDIMEIHLEIDEALEHIVDNQERDNSRLKQRIFELEGTLISHPLFVETFSIV